MPSNPIYEALTRRRNGGAVGEGTPLRDAYGLSYKRRAANTADIGQLEDFQQVQEIRGGANALPQDSAEADAFAQETKDKQQEPVTFEQVTKALDAAEAQLAATDAEAQLRREELDNTPALPRNAAQLREAYQQLAQLDKQRETARTALAAQRKELAQQQQAALDAARPGIIGKVLGKIKDQYSELPWVIQTAIAGSAKLFGGIGREALDVLTFPGRVGMTALGELGDVAGAVFDTEQQAKTRAAQREQMRLRAAQDAENAGGSFGDYAVEGLGSYFRQQAERTGQAVEQLTGPVLGPVADPLGLTSGTLNSAFGTKVTPRDVGGFLGRLVVEISADPTSYLGTGLVNKGLGAAGKTAAVLPGLERAGRFVQRVGATGELLEIGAKTRGALDVAARVQAMAAIPELTTATPALREAIIQGKPIGKLLVGELGDVKAGVSAMARFETEYRSTKKLLEDMARRDPQAYADLVEHTLKPFEHLKGAGIAEQVNAVRRAEALRPRAAVLSPIVAEALHDQVKLSQRLASWRPLFDAYTAVAERFPRVQEVATWVRDAVIQQVPLGGPIARAFGAGKAQGASQKAELYTALAQYTDDLEKALKQVKPNELPRVQQLARQLSEFAPEDNAFRTLVEAGGKYVFTTPSGKKVALRGRPITIDAVTGKKILMRWDDISNAARRAAVEIADIFDQGEKFVLEFQRANGVAIKELADDNIAGYFGRSFTPQMVRWLADNPQAREALGMVADAEARATWNLNAIRARKLRGRSYEGAEEFLRSKLDIPADIPVFEASQAEVLKKNYSFAGSQIEKARMLDALAQELGVKGYGGKLISRDSLLAGLYDDVLNEVEKRAAKGRSAQGQHELAKELHLDTVGAGRVKPGQPELTQRVIRDKLEAARGLIKFRDPLDSARWVRQQLEARGLVVPSKHITQLELAADAGALLPDFDDIERVVEMASTFVKEADVERFAKIAPGLIGKTPDEFERVVWRLYDIMSIGIRRSVLASPSSVAKDLISTQMWLAVAAKNPLAMFKAVKDAIRGHVDPGVLKLLEHEGVLATRKTAEEAAAKKLAGTPLERAAEFVKEKGYLGTLAKPLDPLTKGRASKLASAIPNKLLEVREAGERVARIALYNERRATGYSHREAVEEVYKYLGNFNDYASGKLDKKVLQRFFLFWAWNKKAIGFALRGLLEHPLRAKLLMLLTAGSVQTEGDKLDRWARARGGMVLGRDTSGIPKVIALGAGSYMSPLWGALNSDSMQALGEGDVLAAAGKLGQDATRMGNPIWAGPAELAVNRDSFTGNQIYQEQGQRGRFLKLADHAPAVLHSIPGLRELFEVEPVRVGGKGPDADKVAYYRMNPRWKWFLEWTAPGAMSGAAQVSGAVDPRRTTAEGILRITTGIPTYSVGDLDHDRQRLKQMRDVSIAFEKSVNALRGRPFEVANDRVVPNDNSELGQELARGIAEVRERAKALGQDEREATRRYLAGQNSEYLALYDLGERLAQAHDRLADETQGLIGTGETKPSIFGLRGSAVKLDNIRKLIEQVDKKLSPFAKKEAALERKRTRLDDMLRGPESLADEQQRQQEEDMQARREREQRLEDLLR